jgi:hypothetical protein
MKKGGVGGAVTAKSGSDFEDALFAELATDLQTNGYSQVDILRGPTSVKYVRYSHSDRGDVEIFFKASIHKIFFEPRGVRTADFFSARLEPDTAIYSPRKKTLTIIEKKQQNTTGSVAEKLQTCDYKMLYYTTLCNEIGIKVDLIWQLGPYFEKQQVGLRSVFEYMKSKGSRYFFGHIPVSELKI